MIYLDNSATTYPKPQGVRQAVQRAFTDYGANPGRSGYGMCLRTTQAVYQVRQQAAEFFGAPGPECVLFQPSCTQALNVVLKGFLKPGDHVVITDLEHNAVTRPLEALKARGVTYTVAKVTPGDNDATVSAFRQAIGPKTRLAVCTMASNVFGTRVPVERIAALCHQYDVALCVDAAQGAGLFPIRMEESGIDYLCCAGHKGLYGPMGTGLLLVREPERLLEIEGVRILMLHGHTRHVKSSPMAAVYAAREYGADVLLFGHTHVPLVDYDGTLWVMNPGAAGDYTRPTCGLLTIREGAVICSVQNISLGR